MLLTNKLKCKEMDGEDKRFLVKDGSPSQWIVGLVYVHPLVMVLIFINKV